jgi:hypothetical protein
MHPAESICFISVEEKPKKKARKKRKEKDEKKMTRVRRNFHWVKVTVTAWRVTSMCRKCLCTHVHFLHKAELRFFHFLEIVTGWLVPSTGKKIPVQPGWYLPRLKIRHAENRFLQVGKGAENTKEKSRQCFPGSDGATYIVAEALFLLLKLPSSPL